MNKIVNLSLAKKSVPVRMDVVQYATKPNIVFVLDDYLPGLSAVASLYIEKPDGTKIYNACTIDGNQITYEPTTQSFASLGVNKCQLQIIESNDTAVSFVLYADVTENIIDSSAIESQDEFTALEQAIQTIGDLTELENRVTTAENRLDNLGDEHVTFEEAQTDTTISDNLTLSTIFGRIKRLFTRVKTLEDDAATSSTFTITPISNVILGNGKGDLRNKVVCTSGTLTNRTGADITGPTDVLASGFPKPSGNVKEFGYLSASSVNGNIIRLQITPQGNLTLDYGGSLNNGITVVFNFSYIAS